MEYVVLISFSIAFHAYFGYPLSLIILNLFNRRRLIKSPITLPVTIIIPAFNEEAVIQKKLENTLNLQYPKDMMNILVASDGSTDRTNEIVRQYASRNVGLLEISERGGKSQAEIYAIKKARGEILVFSDADTMLEPNSIQEMINNYADPRIGCVSGTDSMVNVHYPTYGEEYYIGYEMALRIIESRVSSVVGASGQFYSIRNSLGPYYSADINSDGDFKAPLHAVKNGFIAIADPDAICHYTDDQSLITEFSRRTRTIIRGINSLFSNFALLNIFRYRLFSYQLFCHKFLRWIVPFFLCAGFFASSDLAFNNIIFLLIFAVQVILSWLGVCGILNYRLRRFPAINILSYFVKVNVTIIAAWLLYLVGERMIKWSTGRQ